MFALFDVFVQGVGTDVSQLAFQGAVNRVVISVNLDDHVLIGLQKRHVRGLDLGFHNQGVVHRHDLHQLIARPQHTAPGGHPHVFHGAVHRCPQFGVVQQVFALNQGLFGTGQFFFQLVQLGLAVLLVLVGAVGDLAFLFGHQAFEAQHFGHADVTGFEQGLGHVQFALGQHFHAFDGADFRLQALAPFAQQIGLVLPEFWKLQGFGLKNRLAPKHLRAQTGHGGTQAGHFEFGFAVTGFGLGLVKTHQQFAPVDFGTFAHQQFFNHTPIGGLNDLGAAAGNDLTLGTRDLVDFGVVGPGQKQAHHHDAAPHPHAQHEGGFTLRLVVGEDFSLTAHIQVAWLAVAWPAWAWAFTAACRCSWSWACVSRRRRKISSRGPSAITLPLSKMMIRLK